MVGIADIDTRQLVRHLRDHGPMVATILSSEGELTEEALQKAHMATQVIDLS